MPRKLITQVNPYLDLNLEDRDVIITLLLKRRCTFEQAVEYLLSAIPDQIRDDMFGELTSQGRYKHKGD